MVEIRTSEFDEEKERESEPRKMEEIKKRNLPRCATKKARAVALRQRGTRKEVEKASPNYKSSGKAGPREIHKDI